MHSVATVPGRMGVRPGRSRRSTTSSGWRPCWSSAGPALLGCRCPGLQRRTPPGPFHLYHHRWVVRPGAVPRLLESPTPLLRAVLRRVLDRILCWVPVHPAARLRPWAECPHQRLACISAVEAVVCLDLQTFFATITAARVNGLFTAMGYSEAVAWTLTGLCCHQTPFTSWLDPRVATALLGTGCEQNCAISTCRRGLRPLRAGQPGRLRSRPPARRLRLGSRVDLQPVRRRPDLLRSRPHGAAADPRGHRDRPGRGLHDQLPQDPGPVPGSATHCHRPGGQRRSVGCLP